jgi:hypothetical protein
VEEGETNEGQCPIDQLSLARLVTSSTNVRAWRQAAALLRELREELNVAGEVTVGEKCAIGLDGPLQGSLRTPARLHLPL